MTIAGDTLDAALRSGHTEPAQPLAGVRVLDLTQLVAGPFCTMLLADMGADVIKIEPPGGEGSRNSTSEDPDGVSMSFLNLNRNKRGMVINLASTEGREVFYELVAHSDIVVENFRPGVVNKLGIAYEQLQPIRPELVYGSISGFGERGPYANRPGIDLIAQGMSGLISVTGHPDGAPVKVGIPITDLNSGMFCAIGILCAYIARRRIGTGQRVTSSLFATGVSLAVHEAGQLWSTGQTPGPLGSAHRMFAPYQAFRTADGYITLGVTTRGWEAFCRALDREDLINDDRFATNARRVDNRDTLEAEIEQVLARATTTTWVEKLLAAGVPAGPILDYRQVLEDPHTEESGMLRPYEHPKLGPLKSLGTPFALSATPQAAIRPAPLLGQHTSEVLREFSVDEDRINRLIDAGVIA